MFLCKFLCFLHLLQKNAKRCFSIKQMILTSEQQAEHPFAGRNTQHILFFKNTTVHSWSQLVLVHWIGPHSLCECVCCSLAESSTIAVIQLSSNSWHVRESMATNHDFGGTYLAGLVVIKMYVLISNCLFQSEFLVKFWASRSPGIKCPEIETLLYYYSPTSHSWFDSKEK